MLYSRIITMYACEVCHKEYKTASTLKTHITKEHQGVNKADRLIIFNREYGQDARNVKCPVCQTCNIDGMDCNWDLGHIISKKNGGKSTLDNLKPICRTCNIYMGETNWYDYLILKGLPIPSDINKKQTIYKFAKNRATFEHAYFKICKNLVTKSDNTRYRKHAEFVLNNLCDLSLLATNPEFHSRYFKKIFNYEYIKDRCHVGSLETYLNDMTEYADQESFNRITNAICMIHKRKFIDENVDDIIKQTQLSYMGYLCLICGNDRKRTMAAADLSKLTGNQLTNAYQALSLSLYIAEEDDIINSSERQYRQLFDIFATYL